jgi:phosphoribosyl 1,2-cyclic phosphate phosphodiesterase
MATLSITILGCGSSGGVPRLGGHWGACDSTNPRNSRRRCSILVTREDAGEATRVLIDTTPDMRAQLLDAGIGKLDAVLYTHAHADHVHGIDDLRMIVHNMRHRLPVWADPDTADSLLSRFAYAFTQPHGSVYSPICTLSTIEGPVNITGPGGDITFTPFTVRHGPTNALGFRIGNTAYLPDVSDIPDEVWPLLENLDCWIVDALRYTPHPTHSHLEKTLAWIDRVKAQTAVLTNMHIDLDYATLEGEIPAHVTPAYDGMNLTFPA